MIESLLDWISQHAKFEAESGVTNGWNWVKYTDGTCEMWARNLQADQETVRVGDLVNGMYRGFITVPYPIKLIDGVVVSVFNNSNCFAGGSSLMLEENKARVVLQSVNAITTNTILNSCFIKGRYK